MASHGRGGLGGLILGSETTHVLAKSKIPVLVVR
jgi:nucleotide-binding universal stress UspA family protein